jgi:uncharacterized membrane protein
MSDREEVFKVVLVLGMFILFLYFSYFLSTSFGVPGTKETYVLPEVKANGDPWYDRVVKPGEMQATSWVLENTGKDQKFVSDIFGGELIMGMTTRVPTVGGDWANAPNPVQLMGDTNTIYTTTDAETAYDLAVEHNATYVWVPLSRTEFSGYGWEAVQTDKFENQTYFKLLYNNSDVKIYEVLK